MRRSLKSDTQLFCDIIQVIFEARNMASAPEQFDFIVIGCGSGGSACADRALSYGAKVCLIERGCGFVCSLTPRSFFSLFDSAYNADDAVCRFTYVNGVRQGAGHGGT